MLLLIIVLFLLDLPKELESVDLNIDGLIDLEPEWLFKHELLRDLPKNEVMNTTTQTFHKTAGDSKVKKGPKRSKRKRKNSKTVSVITKNVPNYAMTVDSTTHASSKKRKKKHKSKTSTDDRKVTHFYVAHKRSKIFVKPHRVSEDDKINNFTIHVYQSSLNTLRTIKNSITNFLKGNITNFITGNTISNLTGNITNILNGNITNNLNNNIANTIKGQIANTVVTKVSNATKTAINNKIDSVIGNYKDKFIEFATETKNLKIGTRMGTQKVFLNTIETSNRILRRLVDNLVEDLKKETSLRAYLGIANDLDEEVNKQTQSEYALACTDYGFCRSSKGFMDFLVNFLTEILQNDDKKFKMCVDSITEAFKNEDYSHIMDPTLTGNYLDKISVIEKMDPEIVRAALTMLKNMVAARNKPLVVDKGVSSNVVNKSVAVMEVIDTLEEKIPPTKKNKAVWNRILSRLEGWRKGEQEDVQDIMQTLSSHINHNVNKMDDKMADSVFDKLKIILR